MLSSKQIAAKIYKSTDDVCGNTMFCNVRHFGILRSPSFIAETQIEPDDNKYIRDFNQKTCIERNITWKAMAQTRKKKLAQILRK
jgi:hypothetical protein